MATDTFLRSDTVLTTPVSFDFGKGWGETWDVVYPDTSGLTLAQCKELLEDLGGDKGDPDPDDDYLDRDQIIEMLESAHWFDDGEAEQKTDGELRDALREAIDSGDVDGLESWQQVVADAYQDDIDRLSPMMNYIYGIPGIPIEPAEAQMRLELASLPLTVVTVGDEPFLALTGGGMDLSLSICEAYVELGMLPPLHFCDLPRFAGLQPTERLLKTVEACKRSCKLASLWATRRLEDLMRFEADLKAGRL